WRDRLEGLLQSLRRRSLALIVLGAIVTLASALLAVHALTAPSAGRRGGRLLAAPFLGAAVVAWGAIQLRVWVMAPKALRAGAEEFSITLTTTHGGSSSGARQLRRIAGAQRVGFELRTATEIGAGALKSAWVWPPTLQANAARCVIFGALREKSVVLAV